MEQRSGHLRLVRASHPPDVARRHAHNYYLLGLRRGDAGAADEARTHLRHALEFDPAFVPALRALSELEVAAGRFAEARRWLERALVATGPDPDLCFQLGNIALNLGEPSRALALYREAETLETATPELRFNIGLAYLFMGESDQAENILTHLSIEQPASAQVWDALGCTRQQRQNVVGAREAFLKALELDSALNDARDHLAQLLLETGDVPAARRVLERALKQEPDRRSSLHLLGTVLAGEGDFQSAVLCWQRLVDLGQASPDVYQSLAMARLRLNERDRAVLSLREMLGQYPDHAYGHLQLGLLLLEDGQGPTGLAHLEAAARLAPQDATVRQALTSARLLMRL